MKKFTVALFILFLIGFATQVLSAKNPGDNSLSRKEKKSGWKLLFDGKTTGGWKSARGPEFPKTGWEVKDGLLIVLPSSQGSPSGGDIITTTNFKSFELTADFMYTEGANSGIKYNLNTKTVIGCEYQVLDDVRHPDAKAGINGNRTLASLYDLIPASKQKKDNGPNKWNTARIVVRGNHVEHWLNGEMTLTYEIGSPEWKAAVESSKFKNEAGFGVVTETPILLQDHGNKVFYKNIKIKVLK
jgi:hypothetical protein